MKLPTAIVAGKRVVTQWTELRHGANDVLRCVAMVSRAANEDDLRGRPLGGAA